MTPIDPSRRLLALVRTQATAVGARKAVGTPARPAASRAGVGAGEAARIAAPRLQAIARDDPQRRQKAVRIYLETVFARALGARLLEDPAFPRLVDAVEERMRGDGQLAAAADAAGEALLGAAGCG